MYLVILNHFLDTFAWSICFPVFPRVHSGLQLTSTDIGTITAISSMIMFITGPILGKASDIYGRFKMLQLSAFGAGLGMMICSLSKSIPFFLIGRFLGCFVKCTLPVSQAYIADQKDSGTDVSKQNGLLMAIGSVGFIVGPIIGGQISKYSIKLPLYIASAVYFCSFLLLFGCNTSGGSCAKKEKSEEKQPDTAAEKGGTVRGNHVTNDAYTSICALLSVFHHRFFFLLGYAVYEAMFAQHLKDVFHMDGAAIGWMLGYCGLLSVVNNSLILRVVLRQTTSPTTLLAPLALLQAVGLLLWGWSPNVWTTLLSSTFLSFSYNVFLNITQTHLARQASTANQNTAALKGSGSLMGFSSTVDRAARVLASFIGGLALDRFGPLRLGAGAACLAVYCAAAIVSFPLYSPKSVSLAEKNL